MIRLAALSLLVGCVLLFAVTAHQNGLETALWGWATFIGFAFVVTGIMLAMIYSEQRSKQRSNR